MILCYIFNVQTETANSARDSCLKNIIKNHNGSKFQGLMGRNFCAITVRSKKKPRNKRKSRRNKLKSLSGLENLYIEINKQQSQAQSDQCKMQMALGVFGNRLVKQK